MPSALTDITEIATCLGTLVPDLASGIARKPDRLLNVGDEAWARLVAFYTNGEHPASFRAGFENGQALLQAEDGLRRRSPRLVEWKGPHRPPGDDVIPADIRIDHVYQVSCKYLSKITLNAGPARLFDRLLAVEDRTASDWFQVVAPNEYQSFYDVVRQGVGTPLPARCTDLAPADRQVLKEALRLRLLPPAAQPAWVALCAAVSTQSAVRWNMRLVNPRSRLRMLWKLLRISDAPYFVLGTDGTSHVRLRVASTWDWMQAYDLQVLTVVPRLVGQPEVSWLASIRDRLNGLDIAVEGHVEVRWSHGRFQGSPEAKVYLDTPHASVPGYYPLR